MMTQEEKIVRTMAQNRQKEWWYAPDFMREGLGELFVGYEASARLSDLARDYPFMIESRRTGKYMERRVRWETRDEWGWKLAEPLRSIIKLSLPPAFKVEAQKEMQKALF